ncbi:hypothetical protein CDAR_528731 [Caerostris darwini]|uniref:Uncharacterized protein n=1 Tax=Caerostris darwini TaxID=1538125 RepID=A0AAV4UP48_9ARAC|nr:hypothetical protein CDAR_528731 [Caerostris darwini]
MVSAEAIFSNWGRFLLEEVNSAIDRSNYCASSHWYVFNRLQKVRSSKRSIEKHRPLLLPEESTPFTENSLSTHRPPTMCS